MNVKRVGIVVIGCVIVFGGVLGFVAFRNAMVKNYFANLPKPVVTVTAAEIRKEHWRDSVPAVGVLRALNGVDVTVSVGGLVEEIKFESGQKVKAGQLLLKLDTGVEVANLNAALAQANLARITADRQRTLIRSNTVSQAAVDQADAELKVAIAQADSIRAQIEKKTVLAPFSGELGVRMVDLGQYIDPGAVVVNLQDLSVMLVDFTVSQRDLDKIRLGGKLDILTDSWPGQTFVGTVEAIAPSINSQSGMMTVRGRIDNSDGRLRPGMLVQLAALSPHERDVLTLPMTAVTYNLYGDFIYQITPVKDEKDALEVNRIIVTTGARNTGRVEITSGGTAGALIVTTGQAKLQNGARVRIVDDKGMEGKPATVDAETAPVVPEATVTP